MSIQQSHDDQGLGEHAKYLADVLIAHGKLHPDTARALAELAKANPPQTEAPLRALLHPVVDAAPEALELESVAAAIQALRHLEGLEQQTSESQVMTPKPLREMTSCAR